MKIYEKRFIELRDQQVEEKEGKKFITGYALLWNVIADSGYGWREQINKGAITEETLKNSDVRALINHDENKIVARCNKGVGDLELWIDEKGLPYRFPVYDQLTDSRELSIRLSLGLITQSSFGFIAEEDLIEEDEHGILRTVLKISELMDISPVVYPFYPTTTSQVEEKNKELIIEMRKRITRDGEQNKTETMEQKQETINTEVRADEPVLTGSTIEEQPATEPAEEPIIIEDEDKFLEEFKEFLATDESDEAKSDEQFINDLKSFLETLKTE